MVMSLQYTFLSGNVQTFYCGSRLYHKNKGDTFIHVMQNYTQYRPNNML